MYSPPAHLPFALRGLNALDRIAALRPKLDPEMLLAATKSSVGDFPRLQTEVLDALEILCRSARDDANLHWWGRVRFFGLLKDTLVARVLLERRLTAAPVQAEISLHRPLFVTGLYRSGTTYLHRLLATDRHARPLALWELLQPFERPGQRLSSRREIDLKLGMMLRTSSPELDAMHYTRPDLPEECVLGLRLDFRSLVFWRSAPLFGYQTWLLDQNLTGAYRVYRNLLQFFQVAAPGKRLTLKAPMHLLDPESLLKVFPEALIVQTHREPRECVPSDQKLTMGFQAGVTQGVDPKRVVEATTRGQLALANRSIAIREQAACSRIFDVSYRRLVAEPTATVHAIYAHFGLPMDASVEASLARYIDANRQYKHGTNRYTLAQFGLKAALLEERFASYRAYFADYLG